ncbi:MAG: alpha/beta fold hydrolase [Pigmentiphaga sp.]
MVDEARLVEREYAVDGIGVRCLAPAPGSKTKAHPLLFVHGAMHGSWAWESWMSWFADEGWECHALSFRQHPGSYAVPDDRYFSLKAMDYVEDVTTVVRSLGVSPVLIGHSMGSLIVQKVAESGLASGMILVCGLGPGQLGRLREPLPLSEGVMRSKEEVGQFFFNEIDAEALSAYYEKLVPESPGVVNDCNGGGLHVDRSRVEIPALVIGGERDKVKLHAPEEIAQFYGADLMMVLEGSHNFFMESPSLPTASRVKQWLLETVEQSNGLRRDGS